MKILLKQGKVIDPQSNKNDVFDVLIVGHRIKNIGRNISDKTARVINAKGMIVTPGLVDVHVHFREPGQEQKETIKTGSQAAAAGGFTTVVMEPNTSPPIDTPSKINRVREIIKKTGVVHVYTKACITRGQLGERLTDIKALKDAGAVAISDDGNPVYGKRVMRNALKKSKFLNIPVTPHCEESKMYRDKVNLKLKGGKKSAFLIDMAKSNKKPYCLEADFIKRDLELAKITGAKLHLSHVSFAKSVELIARAKSEGVTVTAEAAPHHLILTEDDAKEIGTNAKVNPPLRTKRDVEAIRNGLKTGIIDIIASDHAPHLQQEKALSFRKAPFGLVGLESTLALVITYLVTPGVLTMFQAIEKLSTLPARIFQLNAGSLAIGSKADITIIDPHKKWKIDASRFYSKGRNCPFDGYKVQGKAIMTIVAGRIVMKDGIIIT